MFLLFSNYATGACLANENQNLSTYLQRMNATLLKEGHVYLNDLNQLPTKIRHSQVTSEEALEVIQLFTCCGAEEAADSLIKDVWSGLRRNPSTLDERHYNALLNIYLVRGQKLAPQSLWAEIKQNNVQINGYKYHHSDAPQSK